LLDFTSVLYLGMWHSSRSLKPWRRLTTGAPAALTPPPGSGAVAAALAELVGTAGAQLGTSTLHLFWDLFGILARREVSVFLDAGAYPIARWGLERVVARGVPVRAYRHHDAAALGAMLRVASRDGRLPIVVADGFCPGCGRFAPLAAYRELLRRRRGLVLLDDTQALGIFGEPDDGGGSPYGRGGGGVLRLSGERGDDLLVVSSLGKAFGAPIAFVGGSEEWMETIDKESAVRVHCSPPSAAAIHAAAHALALNRRDGDGARALLADRVRWLKQELAQAGLRSHGGLFPVQRVELPPDAEPQEVRDALARSGIQTVVLAPRCDEHRLVFVLTARHRKEQITLAVRALAACLRHRTHAQRRVS
jgi:8-amino-7-oxononanoate synthase